MLWRYERMALAMGYEVVAGVDEVGMGPLAGPVVGGAGGLPIGVRMSGLDDSKLLTVEERGRPRGGTPREAGAGPGGAGGPPPARRPRVPLAPPPPPARRGVA